MSNGNEIWQLNLREAIPTEAKKETSRYTIALEGWRRGLKLKFYNYHDTESGKLKVGYSLGSSTVEHHFTGSKGDKISKEADNICDNKNLTKSYLREAGIPIPEGKRFGNDTIISEIEQYANHIKYPVVVKPTDGDSGKGVHVGIKSDQALRKACNDIFTRLQFKEILVEKYVTGQEVRLFVLENKVLGAVNRVPPSIIGNGEQSIQQLINEKNLIRKKTPHLYFRPIKIDNEVKFNIKAAGYSKTDILKKGEQLVLKKVSNVSSGGEPIDVTDEITQQQREIAIQATLSVPGLNHCGVDMIINNDTQAAAILELNTSPGLGSHLFPVRGQGRNIPKAIIDYYFPEVKEINYSNTKYFFDYGSIIASLQSGFVSQIEVSSAQKDLQYAKKFILKQDAEPVTLFQWFKRQAYEKSLHGSVDVRESNTEVIVAGGNIDKIKALKKMLKRKYPDNELIEITWNYPVKLGFSYSDGLETMDVAKLESEIAQIDKKIRQINRDQTYLKKRIKLVNNSRTWRYTRPIRYLLQKLK